MPTKRTRVGRHIAKSMTLTDAQKLQHCIGWDFPGTAYGDPTTRPPGPDDDRMREDWIRNREVIRDYAANRRWPSRPIYSWLRFDQGMSHEQAMAAIFAAHPNRNQEKK